MRDSQPGILCVLEGGPETPPEGRTPAVIDDEFFVDHPELQPVIEGRSRQLDCERGRDVIVAIGRASGTVEGEGTNLDVYFQYDNETYRVVNTAPVS